MAEARLQDVCGVLLCGGTGQRLGGVDKPLLDGGNASLAQQALARLAGKLDEWVVSANRNRARYAAFGHPVVADARTDEGPLAGIAAAAGATEREWLYVQPGDAPAPDARLPAALRAQAGAHDAVVRARARASRRCRCLCGAAARWRSTPNSATVCVRCTAGSPHSTSRSSNSTSTWPPGST